MSVTPRSEIRGWIRAQLDAGTPKEVEDTMNDDAIHSTSRTNGTTTILLDAMPDGSVCIACEVDEGPLRQVAHWGNRETVYWMINELYGVLKAMDQQRIAEASTAKSEAA